MVQHKTIIEYTRNNIVEKAYMGSIVVIDKNKNTVFEFSNQNDNFIFRSAQKPFQALNILISGAFNTYDLNEEHLAVISGSHSGTEAHSRTVKEILAKINCTAEDLLCPASYPLDKAAYLNMIKNDVAPQKILHNCSGKHCGMLAVCRVLGLDIKNYTDINHPVQRQIIKQTLELCEFEEEITAKDGCSTPVLAMPLKNMAAGLSNLYNDKNGKKILEACLKYPFLFGGMQRFDTLIIEASNGKIFAKTGAEGLLLAFNSEIGQSAAIKVLSDDMTARSTAVLALFEKLSWVEKGFLKEQKIVDTRVLF
ncbi:MAG: asparaginase [Candidatus Gastranaerophilales bacterium]|nr:asparaginase [Candidatus Gastranaerophilales bacterium]